MIAGHHVGMRQFCDSFSGQIGACSGLDAGTDARQVADSVQVDWKPRLHRRPLDEESDSPRLLLVQRIALLTPDQENVSDDSSLKSPPEWWSNFDLSRGMKMTAC